jgi:TatD DNase family protein
VKLVDTHAHLDQDEFEPDRVEVLRRAREAGVVRIVAVGITADSSQATLDMARTSQGQVEAAVGIHPNYCAQAAPGDWDRIVAAVAEGKPVAVGETGLDRHWDFSPFDLQMDYFHRHLELSRKSGLPVIVHTRDCEADVMAMLREARARGPLVGVMHSFCGSAEALCECLELGMHVSFAGMVTYKKSAELRTLAASVPADRILIETDSPYLSPHPLRSRRNEPANLIHTATVLAQARGTSLQEFARETADNACRLFQFRVN